MGMEDLTYLRLGFGIAGHEVVMLLADANETIAVPLEVVFRHPRLKTPLIVRDPDPADDVPQELLDLLMKVHVRENFDDPDMLWDMLWWQDYYRTRRDDQQNNPEGIADADLSYEIENETFN